MRSATAHLPFRVDRAVHLTGQRSANWRPLAWHAGDMPAPSNLQPIDQGAAEPEQGSGSNMVTLSSNILPAANPSVYGSSQVIVSTPGGVNLRSGASTSAQILAGENQGTILQVDGQAQNGWLPVIDPNGQIGWVYSAYVSDASQGQGTVSPPPGQGVAAASSTPLGVPAAAGGLVGLAVVGGLVIASYWLLVK